MGNLLSLLARLLVSASRNPAVQAAAVQIGRDATARMIRLIRGESKRIRAQGYWR